MQQLIARRMRISINNLLRQFSKIFTATEKEFSCYLTLIILFIFYGFGGHFIFAVSPLYELVIVIVRFLWLIVARGIVFFNEIIPILIAVSI